VGLGLRGRKNENKGPLPTASVEAGIFATECDRILVGGDRVARRGTIRTDMRDFGKPIDGVC